MKGLNHYQYKKRSRAIPVSLCANNTGRRVIQLKGRAVSEPCGLTTAETLTMAAAAAAVVVSSVTHPNCNMIHDHYPNLYPKFKLGFVIIFSQTNVIFFSPGVLTE